MKRNKKDQPIIMRPKPISILIGKAFLNYPTDPEKREIYIAGAKAYEEIANNQSKKP
jgi:hypothetical protein